MSKLAQQLVGGALIVWGVSAFVDWLTNPGHDADQADAELLGWTSGLLRWSADVVGVGTPPLVFARGIDNAASDGRQILVNPSWLNEVLARHCTDARCSEAVVLGVLAHELGHHVGQHALRRGNPHVSELSADYVAGYVLGRASAAGAHFEFLVQELSPRRTRTHPHHAPRTGAIRRGYEKGRSDAEWLF